MKLEIGEVYKINKKDKRYSNWAHMENEHVLILGYNPDTKYYEYTYINDLTFKNRRSMQDLCCLVPITSLEKELL